MLTALFVLYFLGGCSTLFIIMALESFGDPATIGEKLVGFFLWPVVIAALVCIVVFDRVMMLVTRS